MYKYELTGKIHPERVNFTIEANLPLTLGHAEFGIQGDVLLQIRNSNISLIFSSEVVYSTSDTGSIETLKNILDETVRMVVDIYCFVKSYAYEVELIDIKCPALGLVYQFGVRGEWNINKDDKATSEEFSKILNLFTSPENGTFGHALADFRRAVKYPAMTASFCFRAIETIRQHAFEDASITNEAKRRDAGWERLRDELGFTKDDFAEIQSFALPNRHGQYPKITYAERERIMNFTRKVIDRLVDWLYSQP